ncbi:hypothetical protein L7F22_064184 [Adiantum nelumboides]|nr:hypothetical protein [Adiantum nelumboides]
MRLVEELGIKSQVPVLHCDSQSAIMLARNPVFHAKTKHIEVKYHFLRSVLDDKIITLVKVHTDDNPADLLTKSLPDERPSCPHPPSVVMWSIRDATAIFGTQEDLLRSWAQEMVRGICRGFSVPWVVKREAIPYGAQRSNYLMELFKWAVPQLFFRYKLPGDVCNTSGRLECNYLLEGDVFYADQIDDLNGLFLEFSKLFFDRVSNVQLANFLHLITLSVQSGSKETEIESLLASQGIDSYLESDAKWTFLFSDCETLPEPATKSIEPFVTEMASGKARRFFRDTWPPRSLQHAVSNISYRSPHAHRLAACQKSLDSIMKEIEVKKGHRHQRGITEASNSKTETAGAESMVSGEGTSAVLVPRDDLGGQVTFSDREQLARGQPNEQHQELTGRLGEAVVYNHLLEKHGPEQVTWMNADVESGLPYDIVLKGDDGQQKLMEVKTTWSEDKDWFEMSPHEWELACRLGDRFVIVRVFLAGGSSARFLWLPDPPQLCQQRLIKLALVLPRHNDGHGL